MIHPVGERLSVDKAYLPSEVLNERKSRLTLCTGTMATKIKFSEDGTTALGVEIIEARRSGSAAAPKYFVKAEREVIIACGALFSPQILQLR
jgi:choline dehydrogenase-like flavoprotein